jgi:hypothetical protein
VVEFSAQWEHFLAFDIKGLMNKESNAENLNQFRSFFGAHVKGLNLI